MKNHFPSMFTLIILFLLISINHSFANNILKGWIIKNDGTRMDKYIEFFVAGETEIVCFDTADKKNKLKI